MHYDSLAVCNIFSISKSMTLLEIILRSDVTSCAIIKSNKVQNLDKEQSLKISAKTFCGRFKWSLQCSQLDIGQISFHV